MNLYNVTGSRGVSYSLLGLGHIQRNEGNHGSLPDFSVYQGNGQLLQSKAVKACAPISSQNPWKVLLQSGRTDGKRDAVEKLSTDFDNSKETVLAKAESVLKENGKDAVNTLLAEKTSCTYPIEMEDGELSEITYFTFYEKDRIYCKKEGCDGYEWEMPLEDETQYEKVMAFLERQKDKENMRFASQQIFWQDYLSGELDQEGFQHFLDTRVEKGIPNYVNVEENGTYIDKEAFSFCKYMDQPFVELIATTEKEFLDWLMAKVAKRELTLQDTDPVEYHYRMFGDRGQRIHNFHGKLYTYEEVFPLEMQEAREAMAKAGNLIDDFYIRNGWTVERFWKVTSSVGKS